MRRPGTSITLSAGIAAVAGGGAAAAFAANAKAPRAIVSTAAEAVAAPCAATPESGQDIVPLLLRS